VVVPRGRPNSRETDVILDALAPIRVDSLKLTKEPGLEFLSFCSQIAVLTSYRD
jgi:hypothetical protein